MAEDILELWEFALEIVDSIDWRDYSWAKLIANPNPKL